MCDNTLGDLLSPINSKNARKKVSVHTSDGIVKGRIVEVNSGTKTVIVAPIDGPQMSFSTNTPAIKGW